MCGGTVEKTLVSADIFSGSATLSRERERDAGITWQAGLETNTHGICVFFSHCCFACKMVVFWCFDIDFNKLPLDKISNMTYISIYCVSFQLP